MLKELAFTIPPSVVREKCSFLIDGSRVVCDLYKPSNHTNLIPGIVFAGPLSGVKEQSTGAYGSALAEKGYACLSLDHRGFGESEGEPRQNEDFEKKIQDVEQAVEFSSTKEGIDPNRIGTCGVCLGAAYAAAASVKNDKVKSLGFVVGLFPAGGGDPWLSQGREARELYEKTGEVAMIPAASITEDSAMAMQIAVDYYCDEKRAKVKNYVNQVALMYREKWQLFNAPLLGPELNKPFVMIHGKQSFAMKSGTSFYESTPTPNKSLHWIDSLPHTDFYDNPGAIQNIASILDGHFQQSL